MGLQFISTLVLLSIFFIEIQYSQNSKTEDGLLRSFWKEMAPNSTNIPSSSFCTWKDTISCNPEGNIIKMVASNSNLSGSIPNNTIGKLKYIEGLDLSNNYITDLSSDIGEIGNTLKHLNLSGNNISSFGLKMGDFKHLETLDLSYNRLSKFLTDDLRYIPNLKVLNLSRNKIEGIIPNQIQNFIYLESLDLSFNGLNGTISNGLDDLLKKMKLKSLNLSRNSFYGYILDVFQGRLEILDLGHNRFQGNISQIHWNSSFNTTGLVYLDLSENQLTGEILDDIDQIESISHLNLACNNFSSQKFPRIGKLFKLRYLNLSKTNLHGKFSDEISKLSNVKILDLSNNHLTGNILDLNFTYLQVLDLSSNNLVGQIPESLPKLLKTRNFNFSFNNNLTLCFQNVPRENASSFLGLRNDCPRKESKRKSLNLILAITLSIICFFVGIIGAVIRCRKKTSWSVKQISKIENQTASGPFSFQTDTTTWIVDAKIASSAPVIMFEKPLLSFTFSDLLSATSNFDRGTLLAEGRLGPVYRGLLPGGIDVTIKVLIHGSEIPDREVQKELDQRGSIKHRNLVSLMGYCLAGGQRIVLYEYMENGTLQNFLHDLPLGVRMTDDWSNDPWEEDNNEGLISWRFRHKIALGTARALAFLHYGCYPRIIHKEVRSSSIYLDQNLEPRLSDFGVTNLMKNHTQEIFRYSPGYTPPEVVDSITCEPTLKTDVYGFGVVLLELITGKKTVGDDYNGDNESNLVTWVRGLVRKKKVSDSIDPKIRGIGCEAQMEEALRIAYLCTSEIPAKRPSMQQVVGLLKDISPQLEPVKAAMK